MAKLMIGTAAKQTRDTVVEHSRRQDVLEAAAEEAVKMLGRTQVRRGHP